MILCFVFIFFLPILCSVFIFSNDFFLEYCTYKSNRSVLNFSRFPISPQILLDTFNIGSRIVQIDIQLGKCEFKDKDGIFRWKLVRSVISHFECLFIRFTNLSEWRKSNKWPYLYFISHPSYFSSYLTILWLKLHFFSLLFWVDYVFQ